MKVGLLFSFQQGSLDGKFFMIVVEKFLSFRPISFTKNHKTFAWDESRHLRVVEKATSETDLILADLDNNSFSMLQTGGVQVPFQMFEIIQEKAVFFPADEEIRQIAEQKGFVSAYLYHADYECIQSTRFSNAIKDRSFDQLLWDSIKGSYWKSDGWGGVEYDISQNPGRSDLISYTFLMAAWKMWFGLPFFNLIPRKLIETFPDATSVARVGSLTYMNLFENIEDSALPKNMMKQRKLREWLGYRDMITKWK